MRRILTTVLFVLLSCFAFAQTIDNTIKFLGIPVDGTEQQMITSLKGKGFRYDSSIEGYRGQFNGENVQVYIHTNHNLVDRIYVAFPYTSSEAEIKNRFNRLISQFDKSNKYISLWGNDPIPSDENVATEMIVRDKHYQASYRYMNPDIDPESLMNIMVDKMTSDLSEEDATRFRALADAFMNSSEEEQDEVVTQMLENAENTEDTPETIESFFKVISNFESLMTGEVWFTIHRHVGRYYIGLYYDNLANKADGEDL